jgi:hypothetical protein
MAAPHPGSWKTVLTESEKSSCVLDTEQIAAHAGIIYNPITQKWKVLYFLAVYREGTNNKIRTLIWDPDENVISPQEVPDWPVPNADPPRIFCGGHTYLESGEILMAGGIRVPDGPLEHIPHHPDPGIKGLNYSYIFDPIAEEWRVAGQDRIHEMRFDRFYPTLTQLGETPSGFNGKIIAMSGWIEDPTLAREPEFYDENLGWSTFPHSHATQPFNERFEYYPGAQLIPSGPFAGMIFYCLPFKQAYVFNPYWNGIPNGGYWQPVGGLRANYRLNGTTTMLPILPPYNSARVIVIGGSISDTDYNSPAINSIDSIDIGVSNPQWTLLQNFLFFARKNHMTVTLPTDMMLVVGGNVNLFLDDPVLTAKLINPTAPSPSNWSAAMLPAMVYPRAHHSVSLLQPDATVWVAGQGFTKDREEFNIEIYEPGYLFEGERPVIISAPPEISYGVPFSIMCSHPIAAVRLIKFGVTTHSTDMSQRSIGLTLEAGPLNGGFPYTIIPPPNANIAPPGYYMRFVLRGENASKSGQTKIPSVAKIVKLS